LYLSVLAVFRSKKLEVKRTAFPEGTMKKSWSMFAVLVAVSFSLAVPCRAQIASSLDEHGKLVFVNADSPSAKGGSNMSGGPAPSRLVWAAEPPDRLKRIVQEVAERHKVDPALVNAVISTESGWNPQARSRKGAVGLMQLIPGTAQRFGAGNPYDPAQNVEAGTAYLKALLDRYDGDLTRSLAAYNAGEHLVDRSGGVPPIFETQRYVQKVTDAYFRPGSGRDPSFWSAKSPVRREVNANGRVVFTNE
jgi:soluble lytic murein transglycosylase-like protein